MYYFISIQKENTILYNKGTEPTTFLINPYFFCFCFVFVFCFVLFVFVQRILPRGVVAVPMDFL